APAWSPTRVKEVAEPRVGVSVSMALVGARSPLALAPGALGYADYTLKNTGNVGVKNIVRKAFFQAGVGGARWPADGNPITDAAILAGGASRRYDNHAVSSAGMAPGSYDAVVYVEFNLDHAKLPGLYAADDRKVGELVIIPSNTITVTFASTLVGYRGKTDRAIIVLAPILPFVTIVYRMAPDASWMQVLGDDLMVGGRAYYILTNGTVIWTYEAASIPSISLVAGNNLVTYPGPPQNALVAQASIIPYLVIAYVWENSAWVQVLADHTMVTGGVYSLKVTQACIWTWE
ncbi:MAG: hypothetical protein Q8O40_08240, partial [Chloroflexota bacterium]|nr:hypothetical protein [Chloroflexota bacterium]